jgi:hypothetical protein
VQAVDNPTHANETKKQVTQITLFHNCVQPASSKLLHAGQNDDSSLLKGRKAMQNIRY